MTSRRQLTTSYALASGALGGALVLLPARLWRAVEREPVTRAGAITMRVLGARHLGQGAAVLAWPNRHLAQGAPLVDVVHAASMGGLAWLSPRYRRVAGTSALVSAALAAAGLVAARLDRT